MADYERGEVPSDDVAMGASVPAIKDTSAVIGGRALWDGSALPYVPD